MTEARWAYLFVATSHYRCGESPGSENLIESVLFEAGRGIYLVPPRCEVRQATRGVLVAWRDAREAVRAIAETLPFLRASSIARIVAVNSPDQGDRKMRANNMGALLDCHRVKVDVLSLRGGDDTVAEVLLNKAQRMAADLIVMGGYGHSRVHEWILGGTTREMIGRPHIPILMAH